MFHFTNITFKRYEMKEMKTFEPNLLDNKTMHGVYYNEYCLCRKLSNNSPEQLLI